MAGFEGLLLRRNSLKTKTLNYLLKYSAMNICGVYIGKKSNISSASTFIGLGSRANGTIIIKGAGEVTIGRYCAIGDGVRIISSNHAIKVAAIQLKLQKNLTDTVHIMTNRIGVKIGHDVWIGDTAILLPGVTIGNGAIVAAGAIVTKSVEPYAIVAGNPARQIGNRFNTEISDALNSLNWWMWDKKQLQKASFLFKYLLNDCSPEAINIIEKAKQGIF